MREDLQLAFLEHVAHLTAQDYARVPDDLIALGFVPEGMEASIRNQPIITDTLTNVYTQWAGGGGASKIDVTQVSSRLQGLTEDYSNCFQIPPYFAYVLRAFAVLEGIALINDPKYSILDECLPYISQRVLTDASPRAALALRSFVYAAEPTDREYDCTLDATSGGQSYTCALPSYTPVVDAPRMARLAAGFSSFSASAGGLSVGSDERLEQLGSQLVGLVLSPRGSPLQDLLLDEAARLTDATLRDLLQRAGSSADGDSDGDSNGASSPASTGLPALPSFLDPLGVVGASSGLLAKSDEDEAVLLAAATLSAPLLESLPSSSDEWARLLSPEGEDASPKLVRIVAAQLWERRRDLPLLAARLSRRVLLRGVDRLTEATEASPNPPNPHPHLSPLTHHPDPDPDPNPNQAD